MIDDEFIIRVRKFFLLSFSHPVCSPFFLSEGVALNYNGLGNWVERDHARGETVFSLSRARLRSLSFRVIIGRKLHGYLAAARGRYDRYDRASGRETCSRVYRPLRARSKRAPASRLLSRLWMLARIRLLFRSRAADRFKRVLCTRSVHGGRP